MKKLFCFRGGTAVRRSERASMADWCVFCPIARRDLACSTVLLYSDDRVMAFKDINPSAFRETYALIFFLNEQTYVWIIPMHYLVIPIEHIPTVNNLQRTTEDHQLVSHMLAVGRDLLNRDAPNSEEHRFGFHQPPFNSVDHLHLHCLALPFTPSWRQVKYTPLGPLGGFIEAESLLERIHP